MAKLKECPFCGGEAIIWQGPDYFKVACRNQPGCAAKVGPFDTEDEAIAAWNRRPSPSTAPLTLEELRQMDGEPVYIVAWPDWGHWELSADAEDYLADRDPDFYGMKHADPAGRYGLHVMGWLAYRRKPEDDEK